MRKLHQHPSRRRLATAFVAPLALALAGATAGSVTATTEPIGDGEAEATEGGLLAEILERGSITLGIAFEPPYGYEDPDTGEPTGEAPEVAKAVLAEMGIDEVDAVTVEFGALIPGLQAGQYDMIAAGMFINAERAEQIIFSDPDYCVAESFAVAEGNPMDIHTYEDIVESGARLAVVPGTVEVDYALTAGVPEDQMVQFGEIDAQYDALEAGRVDVVPGTNPTVVLAVEGLDGFEATEPFFPLDEDGNEILGCGGYGFLDQEFRDAFNEVLHELLEDGTVAEIVAEFGFSEDEVALAMSQSVESLTGGAAPDASAPAATDAMTEDTEAMSEDTEAMTEDTAVDY